MANTKRRSLTAQAETLRGYWDEINDDPEVQARRDATERARTEGRPLGGGEYPSEYIARRDTQEM
jgi:hypothetical protein